MSIFFSSTMKDATRSLSLDRQFLSSTQTQNKTEYDVNWSFIAQLLVLFITTTKH